jgi:hypothetical protein
MFQLFQTHVASYSSGCCNDTIHVCFNNILHMLQQTDECCRGDETLGRERGTLEIEHDGGRGVAGDGAVVRGGARRDGGK